MKELLVWQLKKNNYYYIESKRDSIQKQIGKLRDFDTVFRNFRPNFYLANFKEINDLELSDGTTRISGLGTVPPLDEGHRHSKWFKFYQSNKDNILYKQERNLVNNVLKKITNDNNFIWY